MLETSVTTTGTVAVVVPPAHPATPSKSARPSAASALWASSLRILLRHGRGVKRQDSQDLLDSLRRLLRGVTGVDDQRRLRAVDERALVRDHAVVPLLEGPIALHRDDGMHVH